MSLIQEIYTYTLQDGGGVIRWDVNQAKRIAELGGLPREEVERD
jgi:hypothetical protein